MEDEWTPQLTETLDFDEVDLPVIWDADFLYGPRNADGADTYVLCEINVSSCFAIPRRSTGCDRKDSQGSHRSKPNSAFWPIGAAAHLSVALP
jgi:hypothetical protein